MSCLSCFGSILPYRQQLLGFTVAHAAQLYQCPESCVVEIINVAFELARVSTWIPVSRGLRLEIMEASHSLPGASSYNHAGSALSGSILHARQS